MRVLWLCGIPREVDEALSITQQRGAAVAWSWIIGHLPPPAEVDLHIACPVSTGPWRDRSQTYKGATFHFVRVPPGRSYTQFLLMGQWFRGVMKAVDPDVVHGWGTEDCYAELAMTLAPVRHIVQVQGLINAYLPYLPKWRRLRWLARHERAVLAKAKEVFVESQFSGALTRPYCGSGVRITQVDHPLRSAFLEATPSTCEKNRILFVGTLDARKGIEDAWAAFQQAAPPEWMLEVVGSGDEAARARLLALQERHPGRLRYHGQCDAIDLVQLMQDSSVFLLPSYLDTGPTALKEALAMGLWPLCYAYGGPAEYIQRFGWGSGVPLGQRDRLAEQLRWLLDTQPWRNTDAQGGMIKAVRRALGREHIWCILRCEYDRISRT